MPRSSSRSLPGLPFVQSRRTSAFPARRPQGAIKLMSQAVQAGRPRSAETAWALVQLSELYLQGGNPIWPSSRRRRRSRTFPGLASGDRPARAGTGSARPVRGSAGALSQSGGNPAQPRVRLFFLEAHAAARARRRKGNARPSCSMALARLDEKGGSIAVCLPPSSERSRGPSEPSGWRGSSSKRAPIYTATTRWLGCSTERVDSRRRGRTRKPLSRSDARLRAAVPRRPGAERGRPAQAGQRVAA